MPDSPESRAGQAVIDLGLTNFGEAETAEPGTPRRILADWVGAYLMRPHADLGRAGPVCPFTARAARLDTIRIGVSTGTSDDPAAILRTMREALHIFDVIPCSRDKRHFRTVLIAFPACDGPDGIAALKRVQRALRRHSVLGGKMIGLFEPASEDTGLLNSAFRPLRCPVPTLAIRMLVAADVPFVLRNPVLTPIFLVLFPLTGARRLLPALYVRLGVSRRIRGLAAFSGREKIGGSRY